MVMKLVNLFKLKQICELLKVKQHVSIPETQRGKSGGLSQVIGHKNQNRVQHNNNNNNNTNYS